MAETSFKVQTHEYHSAYSAPHKIYFVVRSTRVLGGMIAPFLAFRLFTSRCACGAGLEIGFEAFRLVPRKDVDDEDNGTEFFEFCLSLSPGGGEREDSSDSSRVELLGLFHILDATIFL